MAEDYSELLKTYDACKADGAVTVIEDEMATAIRALVADNERLREQLAASVQKPELVRFGCHCDLFDLQNPEPDDCVLNSGNRGDCIYARIINSPTQCEYWKAITPEFIRAALGDAQ